jgi:hypothetical protein
MQAKIVAECELESQFWSIADAIERKQRGKGVKRQDLARKYLVEPKRPWEFRDKIIRKAIERMRQDWGYRAEPKRHWGHRQEIIRRVAERHYIAPRTLARYWTNAPLEVSYAS